MSTMAEPVTKEHLCTDCGKMFATRQLLQSHQRSHTEGPYRCGVCGKEYAFSSGLSRHREFHRKEKRFTCSICNKSFTCRHHLNCHLRRHTDDRPCVCDICGKRYKEQRSLARHQELHSKQSFTCDMCFTPFSTHQKLLNHRKNHGSFSCSLCSYSQNVNEESLARHMRKLHHGGQQNVSKRRRATAAGDKPQRPTEATEPRDCLLCGKVCSSQFAVQLHMKEHINTTMCVRCHRTFSRAADLRRHVKTHLNEAEFMCTCCGGSMPDEQHLNTHMAAIHGIREIYSCPQCAHKSYSHMAYLCHMNKHKEKPAKYGCSVCEKRFTTKWHAKAHLLQHSGEKPFSCSICKKTFAWKYSLKVHMRAHSDDLRFECFTCGRKFLLQAHLEHHMNLHTGKKPYKCRYCTKMFPFPSGLRSHERKHFKQNPYQCLLCKNSFVNYASIAYHMRKQHDNGMSRSNYVLHTTQGEVEVGEDGNDLLVTDPMEENFVQDVIDEQTCLPDPNDDHMGLSANSHVLLKSGEVVLLPEGLTDRSSQGQSSIVSGIPALMDGGDDMADEEYSRPRKKRRVQQSLPDSSISYYYPEQHQQHQHQQQGDIHEYTDEGSMILSLEQAIEAGDVIEIPAADMMGTDEGIGGEGGEGEETQYMFLNAEEGGGEDGGGTELHVQYEQMSESQLGGYHIQEVIVDQQQQDELVSLVQQVTQHGETAAQGEEQLGDDGMIAIAGEEVGEAQYQYHIITNNTQEEEEATADPSGQDIQLSMAAQEGQELDLSGNTTLQLIQGEDGENVYITVDEHGQQYQILLEAAEEGGQEEEEEQGATHIGNAVTEELLSLEEAVKIIDLDNKMAAAGNEEQTITMISSASAAADTQYPTMESHFPVTTTHYSTTESQAVATAANDDDEDSEFPDNIPVNVTQTVDKSQAFVEDVQLLEKSAAISTIWQKAGQKQLFARDVSSKVISATESTMEATGINQEQMQENLAAVTIKEENLVEIRPQGEAMNSYSLTQTDVDGGSADPNTVNIQVTSGDNDTQAIHAITERIINENPNTYSEIPTTTTNSTSTASAEMLTLTNISQVQDGNFSGGKEVLEGHPITNPAEYHLVDDISKNIIPPLPFVLADQQKICDKKGEVIGFEINDELAVKSSKRSQYFCIVCQIRTMFSSVATLKRHYAALHSGGEQGGAAVVNKCDACNREFTRKDSWKKHLKRHSAELEYPCTSCEEKFARRCVLYDHMENVHGICKWKQARMYQSDSFSQTPLIFLCPWCNLTLSSTAALTKHQERHSAQPSYECEYCQEVFQYRCVLYMHMNAQHEWNKFANIERRMKSGNFPMMFCELCGKQFNRKTSYLTHMAKSNGEQKRSEDFPCTYCGLTFVAECVLSTHLIGTHGSRLADYNRSNRAQMKPKKPNPVTNKPRKPKNIQVISQLVTIKKETETDTDGIHLLENDGTQVIETVSNGEASRVGIIAEDEENVFESNLTPENMKATLRKVTAMKRELVRRRQRERTQRQKELKLAQQKKREEEEQLDDEEGSVDGRTNEEEIWEDTNTERLGEVEDVDELEDGEIKNEVNDMEEEDYENGKDLTEGEKDEHTLANNDDVVECMEIENNSEQSSSHVSDEQGSISQNADTEQSMQEQTGSSASNVKENSLQCPSCEASFDSQAEIEEHLEDCSGSSLFECEFCPCIFTNFPQFSNHVCNLGPSPVPCPTCEAKFFNSYHLYNHMEKRHASCNSNCHTCVGGFKFLQEYFLHADEVHSADDFKCKDCSQKFKTRAELNHHYKMNHEDWSASKDDLSCPSCKEVFTNAAGLRRHRKNCDVLPLDDEIPATTDRALTTQCPECQKHVPVETLPQHLVLHNKGIQRVNILSLEDSTKKVSCAVCQRKVQQRFLPHHMKQHAGKVDAEVFKMYKGQLVGKMEECDRCGSLISSRNIENHKQGNLCKKKVKAGLVTGVRLKDGKIECDLCGKYITCSYREKHKAEFCKGRRNDKVEETVKSVEAKQQGDEEEEGISKEDKSVEGESTMEDTGNKEVAGTESDKAEKIKTDEAEKTEPQRKRKQKSVVESPSQPSSTSIDNFSPTRPRRIRKPKRLEGFVHDLPDFNDDTPQQNQDDQESTPNVPKSRKQISVFNEEASPKSSPEIPITSEEIQPSQTADSQTDKETSESSHVIAEHSQEMVESSQETADERQKIIEEVQVIVEESQVNVEESQEIAEQSQENVELCQEVADPETSEVVELSEGFVSQSSEETEGILLEIPAELMHHYEHIEEVSFKELQSAIGDDNATTQENTECVDDDGNARQDVRSKNGSSELEEGELGQQINTSKKTMYFKIEPAPQQDCELTDLQSIAVLTNLQNTLAAQLKKEGVYDSNDTTSEDYRARKKQPPVERVTCKLCEKSVTKYHLKTHIEGHEKQEHLRKTKKAENRFECSICLVALKYKRDYTRHMLNHQGLVKRKFKCPDCDKAFHRPSQLTEHSVVHTRQRDHVCGGCGKGFTTKNNLRRHIKVIHEEKELVCVVCWKEFAEKADLEYHKETEHDIIE